MSENSTSSSTETESSQDNHDDFSTSIDTLLRAYSKKSLTKKDGGYHSDASKKSNGTAPTQTSTIQIMARENLFSIDESSQLSKGESYEGDKKSRCSEGRKFDAHFWSVGGNDVDDDDGEAAVKCYTAEEMRQKYVNVAPILRVFCPCCCCLYHPEPSALSSNDAAPGQRHEVDEDDPPPLYVNKNVLILLSFSLLYSIADTVSHGVVLSAYVYQISGGMNLYLGAFEAVRVVARLLCLMLLEKLALKNNSILMWIGGSLAILACCLNAAIVWSIGEDTIATDELKVKACIVIYYFVMALKGFNSVFFQTPVHQMYEKSLSAEQFEAYNVIRSIVLNLGTVVGPFLSLLLFLGFGNNWSVNVLGKVMLVGISLMALAAVCLLLTNEKWMLPVEADVEWNEEHEEDDAAALPPPLLQSKVRENYIPLLISCSSIIILTGTGMIYKLFPLYFKTDLSLSPVAVCTIYSLVPIVGVANNAMVQGWATKGDSVLPALLITKTLALLALYILALMTPVWWATVFLVLVFILRAVMANVTYPFDLQEAVRKEFIIRAGGAGGNYQKGKKGLWVQVEPVGMIHWALGAVLGAMAADSFGYAKTLLITAFIQTFGVLGYYFIIPLQKCDDSMRDCAADDIDILEPLEVPYFTEPLLPKVI